MTVWEDTVELPSGHQIDDYSGVDLADGVIVVATDIHDRLLMFKEYKYAVDDTVMTCPAGGVDKDETPEQAALRELKEETGYTATGAELITSLFSYPSKITHKDHIVRIKNAITTASHEHDVTEQAAIGSLEFIEPSQIKSLIDNGKINTSYMVAALALAFPDCLS